METGVFPFTSKVRAQNDVIPELTTTEDSSRKLNNF